MLDDLQTQIDAVVSLCRVGTQQTDRERIEFWLVRAARAPALWTTSGLVAAESAH